MRDLSLRGRVVLGAAALLLVAALTAVRGPVVLLAAASAGLVIGAAVVLAPLLRHDPVDWDWAPEGRDDVPPEPGIALLQRTLAPGDRDTEAAGRLHALVRALAADRAPHGDLGDGPLATYLAAPPRRPDLDEVERLVTQLETLTPATAPKETP